MILWPLSQIDHVKKWLYQELFGSPFSFNSYRHHQPFQWLNLLRTDYLSPTLVPKFWKETLYILQTKCLPQFLQNWISDEWKLKQYLGLIILLWTLTMRPRIPPQWMSSVHKSSSNRRNLMTSSIMPFSVEKKPLHRAEYIRHNMNARNTTVKWLWNNIFKYVVKKSVSVKIHDPHLAFWYIFPPPPPQYDFFCPSKIKKKERTIETIAYCLKNNRLLSSPPKKFSGRKPETDLLFWSRGMSLIPC